MESKLGTLNESFIANFFITDGDIFSEETKILSNWVQGKWHRVNDSNIIDFSGDYLLSFNGNSKNLSDVTLTVYGDKDKPRAKIGSVKLTDSLESSNKIFIDDENISLTFNLKKKSGENSSEEYKLLSLIHI